MAGPACAPARRCATRPPARCTVPATAAGRGCWTRNAPTSTTSGTARTWRSRATRNVSKRCVSGYFTCCRPARAPNAARSPARGSPEPGMTATPFGTPKVSCYRCSPTPHRMRSPTRCGGGRRRWTWPRSGRPSSAWKVPPFPGGPSADRSPRPTGRPARRPGTSTPTSRWRSSGTASSPATVRWRRNAALRC
ncbi:Uncharacterised protein [Mycobacterium tuberculosis]|uniref:Uncharacterized protein n=1 Tax=Mycobacterium tuberculosis TaxID=1773 RepID=A0A654TDG0_MYCTX|nr:Uncharacterised protein [Mycobacterium tuberculosis]CFR73920.1 Uncharacterised protein [Mycobacterium tuberculosis]CFS05049.1 Uncharacterised protein [Mycobacterium tuberculosis]CFS37109.1 Uncharacterised protein [Mycobacterium tuberculosis]CFV43528.1 Uncharacterised protein [Mycobacterium tuberculosis]